MNDKEKRVNKINSCGSQCLTSPMRCTCPSGDGSLRWPCLEHPPEAQPIAWDVFDREGILIAGRVSKEDAEEIGSRWEYEGSRISPLYDHPPPSAPATVDEETAWREGWAMAYSDTDKLYTDNGELQDNSDFPMIDRRRDSAMGIRRKIHERGKRALVNKEDKE